MMAPSGFRDDLLYRVVVNLVGQYSLWPVERAALPGWFDTGCNGQKAVCLGYIDDVWKDMRLLPRS